MLNQWGYVTYNSLPNAQDIILPIRARVIGAVASDIGYTPGTGGTSVQIGAKDDYTLAFRPVYPTLNNTPFTNGTIHFWIAIGVAI